jgi:hypothetical protein
MQAAMSDKTCIFLKLPKTRNGYDWPEFFSKQRQSKKKISSLFTHTLLRYLLNLVRLDFCSILRQLFWSLNFILLPLSVLVLLKKCRNRRRFIYGELSNYFNTQFPMKFRICISHSRNYPLPDISVGINHHG